MNNAREEQISASIIVYAVLGAEARGRLSFSLEQPIFSDMEKTNSKTASPLAPSAVLDLQALDNIRVLQGEDSPAFLDKIIRTYLDHARRLLATLHEAAARNEALALQKTAHSLKSSSAALGATTLAALCRDLEMMGHQQNLENVTTVLAAATAAYEMVREALLAELQRET